MKTKVSLANISFDPQGCVWDATLLVKKNNVSSAVKSHGMCITCCTHEEKGGETTYSIELCLKGSEECVVDEGFVEGMEWIKNRLQQVLNEAFGEVDGNESIPPRVCIVKKTADNVSSATKKDDAQEVSTLQVPTETSIAQEDLNSISSDNTPQKDDDKLNAKIQERRIHRQSQKKDNEEQHSKRDEFQSSKKSNVNHYESTHTLLTEGVTSSNSSIGSSSSSSNNEEKKSDKDEAKSARKDKEDTAPKSKVKGKESIQRVVKKMFPETNNNNNTTKSPSDTQIIIQEMNRRGSSDAEKRMTVRGLVSQKSLANMRSSFNSSIRSGEDEEDDLSEEASSSPGVVQEEEQERRSVSNEEVRSARKGIGSRKTLANLSQYLDNDGEESNSSSEQGVQGEVLRSSFQKKCQRGQLPMSSRSLLKQGKDAMNLARELEDVCSDDSSSDECHRTDPRSSFKNKCLRGQLPMSSRSLLKQGNDAMDLARELEAEYDDEPEQEEPQVSRRTSGELRSAAKGIVSRSSMLDFSEAVEPKKKQNRRISFEEDTIPLKQKEDDRDTNRMADLVFSNREIESNLVDSKEEHKDILSEGQIYLGISMLVYMYSHLRETVRQGLTRVRMEDIDVHSCHSQYNARRKIKYLSKTKTAGSIIRVVIDELDGEDENDADHELLSGEGKEYEKR